MNPAGLRLPTHTHGPLCTSTSQKTQPNPPRSAGAGFAGTRKRSLAKVEKEAQKQRKGWPNTGRDYCRNSQLTGYVAAQEEEEKE
jgi:hypothetical protein